MNQLFNRKLKGGSLEEIPLYSQKCCELKIF